MVILVAVHASRRICWAPISGSQGMLETAVIAFHFHRFLVAAVFVYVSFYGVNVLLFVLKLFQLRRGGFVCSDCLAGKNNVISPLGKPDLLIVHTGVVPFGKKRNIKARQVIIQILSYFHRSSASFFVRMRSSLRKFKNLVSFRFT